MWLLRCHNKKKVSRRSSDNNQCVLFDPVLCILYGYRVAKNKHSGFNHQQAYIVIYK